MDIKYLTFHNHRRFKEKFQMRSKKSKKTSKRRKRVFGATRPNVSHAVH